MAFLTEYSLETGSVTTDANGEVTLLLSEKYLSIPHISLIAANDTNVYSDTVYKLGGWRVDIRSSAPNTSITYQVIGST